MSRRKMKMGEKMSKDHLVLFRNDFTFKFVDKVTSDGFFDQGSENIITFSDKTDNKRAREVIIEEVGTKCQYVKTGDRVILEALMWTVGFKHNGEKTWISNEDKILAFVEETQS